MSLTSEYSKAWRKRYGLPPGWFVNTQPNDPLPIGLKGELIGHSFRQSGPFKQLHDVVPKVPAPPDNSEWQFQSSADIKIRADVEGKTGTNIDWLAGTKAGIKADFGRQAGVSVLGTHKWFHRFPDQDAVRSILRKAAHNGHLKEGDAIVVERQLTGKGVMLVSQGDNASIEVLANGSVAPGGVKIADFSADFSVTKSSGAVAMEKFGDGSVIAARVMYVGHRGMWWWRKITVSGFTTVTPEQEEAIEFKPVEGDGDDEFFVLF